MSAEPKGLSLANGLKASTPASGKTDHLQALHSFFIPHRKITLSAIHCKIHFLGMDCNRTSIKSAQLSNPEDVLSPKLSLSTAKSQCKMGAPDLCGKPGWLPNCKEESLICFLYRTNRPSLKVLQKLIHGMKPLIKIAYRLTLIYRMHKLVSHCVTLKHKP